jgi:hypothetical protein
VVVVGGYNRGTGNVLSSSEIYDETTGVWTSARSLRGGHWLHTETALADGTPLVVGGRAGFSSESYSEIFSYDESGREWKLASDLKLWPVQPFGDLLQDGSLLIAGGTANFFGPYVAIAEFIEPVGDL